MKTTKDILKNNPKINIKVVREYNKLLKDTEGIVLHERGDYRAGKPIKDMKIRPYGIPTSEEPINF